MTPRPFSILAVCTANICRSPIIEILLRAELDPQQFEVSSAGVQGWPDEPMDSMAAMELARLGHTPGTFRSKAIDSDLVNSADLILVATKWHRSEVLTINPRVLRRTFTLVEFAALSEQVYAADPLDLVVEAARQRSLAPVKIDISDPFRHGPEVHRQTADQIDAAVRTISSKLNMLVATF